MRVLGYVDEKYIVKYIESYCGARLPSVAEVVMTSMNDALLS